MLEKLNDAAMPFYPENQTHLVPAPTQLPPRQQFELYGPLWIYITMIVEFLIVGHFQKLMNQESPPQDLIDTLARKFGILSQDT